MDSFRLFFAEILLLQTEGVPYLAGYGFIVCSIKLCTKEKCSFFVYTLSNRDMTRKEQKTFESMYLLSKAW